MSPKAAGSKKSDSFSPKDDKGESVNVAALQAKLRVLELELEQKNVLMEGGFVAFTQAAEKLQESHKKLQKQVADLNLELDMKNRELERNLEEREKVKTYLSNIFESLPVGVLVTDLSGAITSVNRAGLGMLGQKADALMGQNVDQTMGATLLDEAPQADMAADKAAKQGAGKAAVRGEATARGTASQDHEDAGQSVDVFDPDEPLTFVRPDGATLKLQASLTPMTGEGKELGYILNLQDVTLLKQLEEHAQRRNRFTVMGEMAANMAHEIRNPLGSIELFASLVKKGLEADEEKMALMNHISSGIAGMNHIISNVLEYSKPRPLKRKKLDIQALAVEVGEFIRYMAEQNGVSVSYDLDEKKALHVKGDEDLLRQVFHNLALNAIQSMTEGGDIVISVHKRILNEPRELSRFDADVVQDKTSLPVVRVGVKNTGPGISREMQGKIFDPFFTTKARGTGLGLAIVHNIVESHQATIDVESRINKGAEFIVTFPQAG